MKEQIAKILADYENNVAIAEMEAKKAQARYEDNLRYFGEEADRSEFDSMIEGLQLAKAELKTAKDVASQISALFNTEEIREKIARWLQKHTDWAENLEWDDFDEEAQEGFRDSADNLLSLLFDQKQEVCPPQELVDGIAKHLLAEWIAIDKGEIRGQALKYIDEAQELFDYLHVIGFRNIGTGSVTKKE